MRWCHVRRLTVAVLATLSAPAASLAQPRIPEEFTNLQVLAEDIARPRLIALMRDMTSEVGGDRCSYCHTVSDGLDQPDDDFASDDKVTKRKAREMLRMVETINGTLLGSLPERSEPTVDVTCVTCHAGKRRPTTLVQELTWAFAEGGIEAFQARYDELREEFYGRGAYDFGPGSLDAFAQSVGRSEPAVAFHAVELNLRYHPESVQTWLIKGQLHSLNDETEAAIEAFERSLELAPDNPFAVQQLERLRGGGA